MVPVNKTEMTFSVSRDKGRFEWAGDNLFSVFCQPTRLLDPDMWRLIYDVLRFNACSRSLVVEGSKNRDMSIGEYLDSNGYSASFRDNYLIVRHMLCYKKHHKLIELQPMTAAVWSTSPDKCTLSFPAKTLVKTMCLLVILCIADARLRYSLCTIITYFKLPANHRG